MNSTKYFEVKLCSEYSSCVLWTYDALLKEKVLTSVLGKSKGENRDGAKLDSVWAASLYVTFSLTDSFSKRYLRESLTASGPEINKLR